MHLNRFSWFSIDCHCFCTDFHRFLLNFIVCLLIFFDCHRFSLFLIESYHFSFNCWWVSINYHWSSFGFAKVHTLHDLNKRSWLVNVFCCQSEDWNRFGLNRHALVSLILHCFFHWFSSISSVFASLSFLLRIWC